MTAVARPVSSLLLLLCHDGSGPESVAYIFVVDGAGKGTRTPERFRVAVFETAALPLGYPGNIPD